MAEGAVSLSPATVRPVSWVLPTCFALLLFAIWAVVPRAIAAGVSGTDQQILASIGLLPVLATLARGQVFKGRALQGSAIGFVAGILTSLGNLAYYAAIARGGAASQLAPLTALYPVVTVILSIVFLREKITRGQAAGVVMAIVSIYLFSAEAGARTAGFSLLPLLSIGLWGLSAVGQKLSVAYAPPKQVGFAYLGASLPVSLLLALTGSGTTLGVSVRDMLLCMALGTLLGAGNVFLVMAYSRAGQASVVTTLSGLYWVLVLPIGVLVFGEPIDGTKGIAVGLALLATVAMTHEGVKNA